MFAMIFYGLLFALGGTIAASPGVALTGLLAMILGLLFFALQHWLSD